MRAQLVAFSLLANEGLNELVANDQFLGTFIILTVYFMAKERPYASAASLSLGLSIKAGGLLLIPALLGSI